MRTVRLALFGTVLASSVASGVWTTNGPASEGTSVPCCVVVDAFAPGTLYAVGSGGLVKSADDGRSWSVLPQPNPDRGLLGAPLAAGPAGTVYAESFWSVAFIPHQTVYKSTDGGSSWSLLFEGVFSYDLRVDPTSPNVLYRASNALPILDGGPISPSAFHRSSDGGVNWTEIDSGLGLEQSSISAFAIDPRVPSTIYLATQPNAGGVRRPALYRSRDSGATWDLLADVDLVGVIAIDPFSSALYVSGGFVTYRSTDGGESFATLTGNLSRIVFDPVRSGTFYATPAGNSPGVFVSHDGGETLTSIHEGLSGRALTLTSLAVDANGRFLHATVQAPGIFDDEIGAVDSLSLNAAHPFTVTLTATDPRTGRTGSGVATPVNDLWGYFSIPAITGNPNNPEVFVKLLDGTTLNGSYWFFYGGLTDLGFTLTVTEDATGRQKTYVKPGGSECGGSDTAAFPP